MGRYRKKPIVIEAFQMTRERRVDNSEWPEWLNRAWQLPAANVGSMFCSADGCLADETHTPLFIQTLDGTRKVNWDDWIIQGAQGELYQCEGYIFRTTYESAEAEGME